MKLGNLFLDRPVRGGDVPGGFNLVPHIGATPTSPSIVFEWPIRGRQIPFATRSFLPEQGLHWDMGLWLLTDDVMAQIDGGNYLAVNEKPTLALQKVVQFVQNEWLPVARAFDGGNPPTEQLLGVWMNYPDVFYTCIARHKRPGLLSRQNFYIVLRWASWKYRRRTMQECVDEMQAAGCGGGKLPHPIYPNARRAWVYRSAKTNLQTGRGPRPVS